MNTLTYENLHETKKHVSIQFPYNTYLCSIPLDFTQVPLHWHNDVEIIVIKKGCGIISVDTKPRVVKAGDIVLVRPGQLHSISQHGKDCMEYENILFKSSLLKSTGYDLCNDKFIQPLFSGSLNICPVINNQTPYYPPVITAINEIDHLCDLRPYAYQLSIKAHLFQILYTLVSNCGQNKIKPINQKSLKKIKTILSYIANNLQENIAIEDIANYCFYSKSYFMKFFKETMGVSFIQYLNDYRLEIAAELLTTTTDNILDIAFATGFNNISYFNRCFKKKYGVSPRKYRF